MGFFESPPPQPPLVPPPPPPWLFPPDNVLGAFVPLRSVFIGSNSLLAVAERFVAYPAGFEFTVRVQARREQVLESPAPDGRPLSAEERQAEELRIGVVLADGARASSQLRPGLEEPEAPVVSAYHGAGGGNGRYQRCWVWPLPPDGPLRLVIEWPAAKIEETWGDVDGSAIRTAAERSHVLWER